VLLVARSANQIQLATDGERWRFQIHATDDRIYIQSEDGRDIALLEHSLLPKPVIARNDFGSVIAPNSAVVAIVHVEVGQRVEADAALVTLEAMKMLNILRAPRQGTVSAIFASAGQAVAAGTVLVEFTDDLPPQDKQRN